MPRSAVGALALLLALAGCGGDPEADPSPSPTPSAGTPTSTAPTPPAMPAAARANTKAGAVAFVRHYVEVQNYASITGDTDTLRTLTATRCAECRAIADLITKVYRAGGRIEGDGWRIKTIRPADVPAGPGGISYYDAVVDVRPQSIASSPDSSPSSYVGNPRRLMTFALTRTGRGWQLSRILASKS